MTRRRICWVTSRREHSSWGCPREYGGELLEIFILVFLIETLSWYDPVKLFFIDEYRLIFGFMMFGPLSNECNRYSASNNRYLISSDMINSVQVHSIVRGWPSEVEALPRWEDHGRISVPWHESSSARTSIRSGQLPWGEGRNRIS